MTRSLAESIGFGSPVDWARDWLTFAGFPITGPNLQVVYSWMVAESGGGGGMWNPLNTTQGGYAGETDFNSVGVKNYAHRADGIDASGGRHGIHNGFYANVVAAFERGDDAQAVADAIIASPWGTRHIQLLNPPESHPTIPTPPEVVEMQVIALPQMGAPPGRTALAVWDPAHPNRIALENGGRLVGDEPTPIPNVHVWTDPRIPPGVVGIGISPVFTRLGHIRAIVLACTGGNTYVARLP